MHGAPQNPAVPPLPQPLGLWGPRLSPVCPPFVPSCRHFARGPVPAAPEEPRARGERRGGGRRLSSSPRLNFPAF